jgi:predicted DNA-binding transcriptional regulator YafY
MAENINKWYCLHKITGDILKLNNLHKILKAIDLLSSRQGVTIDELADELKISRRSVHRLLNDLHDLNFPLYDEREPYERQKTWKLEPDYVKKLPNLNIPDIKFTSSEMIAITLLKDKEAIFANTEIGKSLKSAVAKIDAVFPKDFIDSMNKVKSVFTISNKMQKDYSEKGEVIDSLTTAILQCKECKVTYHTFYNDKVSTFDVQPLSIFEHNGGLYAFVYLDYYDSIRTLALERIKAINVSDKTFDSPKYIDLEDTMKDAFGVVYDDPVDIKLWVSPEQSKYVKSRKYAPNQEITENDDGSIILEFSTSGWLEVKQWILSLGAEAKVLEPEEMVIEILEEYKKIQAVYK